MWIVIADNRIWIRHRFMKLLKLNLHLDTKFLVFSISMRLLNKCYYLIRIFPCFKMNSGFGFVLIHKSARLCLTRRSKLWDLDDLTNFYPHTTDFENDGNPLAGIWLIKQVKSVAGNHGYESDATARDIRQHTLLAMARNYINFQLGL